MGYFYKKKYSIIDCDHVIFNFKLKKVHTDKIKSRRIQKYGSIFKYNQIKNYMHRKYYNFSIGVKHEKKYI